MGKALFALLCLMSFAAQSAPQCKSLFTAPKVGIKDYSLNRDAYTQLSELIGPEVTPELYKTLKAVSVLRFTDRNVEKLLKKDLDYITAWLKKPSLHIEGYFLTEKSEQQFIEKLKGYQAKILENKYSPETLALLRIYLESEKSSEKNQAHLFLKKYKLSLPEYIAVLEYTLMGFKTISHKQRNKETDSAHVNYLIQNIDRALEKLPDFEGQVYRGVNLRPDEVAQIAKGAIYTAPTYMSTSKTQPFPKAYRMVIKTKTGKDISGLAAIKNEDEVLIRKGTQFKIDDIFTNSFATFIYMTEL